MTIEQLYDIYLQHQQVTTDSRNCPEDSMFFALKGETFDGNQYAASALREGCAVAVVDDPSVATDSRFIVVDNVLNTLQQLAAHHRRQWGGCVLQITGTNGKTTTKELVAAVLSRKYNVLYTQGNLNNHIGVPLTLLRLRQEHNFAVIETGANHPGEIEALTQIVRPDFGLITNVGRAHLEGFGSFEGVKRTKGELYEYLRQHDRVVFRFADSKDLAQMAGDLSSVLYGTRQGCRVTGRVQKADPYLTVQWQAGRIKTNLIGTYNLPNVLAAICVGDTFYVPASDINAAIESYQPTMGRSQLVKTAANTLIVDAYNANPTSMALAIDNFKALKAKNKMAIIGEMRELGPTSVTEHQKIVNSLKGIDTVWLVGNEFTHCKHSFTLFNNVEEVKAQLQATPLKGHCILIKGSNGTRLHQLPCML